MAGSSRDAMFDPIRDSAASAESGIMPSPHSETQAPHNKSWAHAEGGAASADIPFVFAVPLSPMECAVRERGRDPHDSRQLGRLFVFEGPDSWYAPTRGPGAGVGHGRPLPASPLTSEMYVDDVQLPRSTEALEQGEQPDALHTRSDHDAADLTGTCVPEAAPISDVSTNRSQPMPETLTEAAVPVPSRHGLPDVVSSGQSHRYRSIWPAPEPWQAGIQADQQAAGGGTWDDNGSATVASSFHGPRHYRNIMPDPEGQRRLESLEQSQTQNIRPEVGSSGAPRLTAPSPDDMALDAVRLDQNSDMHVARGADGFAIRALQGQQASYAVSPFASWAAAQSRPHSSVQTTNTTGHASSKESTPPHPVPHDGSMDPWRRSRYGTKPNSSEDERVFSLPRPRNVIIKGVKREVQRLLEADEIDWDDWMKRSPTYFATLQSMLNNFCSTVAAHHDISDLDTVKGLQYSVSKTSVEGGWKWQQERREARLGKTQESDDITKLVRGHDENGYYAVFSAIPPPQGDTARRPCHARALWNRLFPTQVSLKPTKISKRESRREANKLRQQGTRGEV